MRTDEVRGCSETHPSATAWVGDGCKRDATGDPRCRRVQCPNASCGRTSHLGEDPLGRIFRCPRCLDQASRPAGRNGADSGWTAVLGPLPRRSPSLSPGLGTSAAISPRTLASHRRSSLPLPLPCRRGSCRASRAANSWSTPSAFGPTIPGSFGFQPTGSVQESGEVYVGPFRREDGSRSAYDAPAPRAW